MGWLIALGILALLAAVPLGISLRYDAGGADARLRIGFLRIRLYPRPQKEEKKSSNMPPETVKRPREPEKEEPKEDKPISPSTEPSPGENQPDEEEATGGSWRDFLPLMKVALDFLGDLRRKLRVNFLRLRLILAGEDPCDLAVNYGRTWAAVGNLLPQLERLLVIKKRDVEVECDFSASETRVIARADITITLGRLLALAVPYGIRALKEYWNLKNHRKGGVQQ